MLLIVAKCQVTSLNDSELLRENQQGGEGSGGKIPPTPYPTRLGLMKMRFVSNSFP